jgi:hypothetical protein
MDYQCGACGAKVSGDMLIYRDHMNKHIIELIKNDHPEWVETGGICKKCVEYYQSELKGSVFHDAACVKRQRKINQIFQKISSVFVGNRK